MDYKKIRSFARELRRNQTPAEEVFWNKVKNRQFLGLKFNRQFIIQHQDIMESRAYFIADFHCFEHKLIIEIDGPIHEFQVQYDRIRENILIEMGYKVIRFKNEEVLQNWSKVEAQLRKVIHST
ncbi:MAG: endonuclease domain-containing protein [Bacteroidota bacterium]